MEYWDLQGAEVGGGREQSAGFALCVGRGSGLGKSRAAGAGRLCPEEQEAAAVGWGSGEGFGGHGRAWAGAWGENALLGQRTVCRGRKTRGALSTGSCFQFSVTMLCSSWQLGRHLSPPLLSVVALRGSVHKAWQP